MLKYIDNYNYSSADEETIDEQIEQLINSVKRGSDAFQIYRGIRDRVYREIKIEELAITRIIGDLIQIKQKSERAFSIVLAFVANPMQSYKQIADAFGISKQRVNYILQQYSQNYVWLKNLLQIKGKEDSKNQNNRSIFFTPLVKNPSAKIGKFVEYEQPSLFDDL